jgi:hypothetical protein
MRLLLPALLLLTGCQVFGPDGAPDTYFAHPYAPQGSDSLELPLSVPDTVAVGSSFEATVTTVGDCDDKAYRTHVDRVPGGFEIRAYNERPRPDIICVTYGLIPHTVTLRAGERGQLVVRAVGPNERYERVVVVR